jgi:hypothetical protein
MAVVLRCQSDVCCIKSELMPFPSDKDESVFDDQQEVTLQQTLYGVSECESVSVCVCPNVFTMI